MTKTMDTKSGLQLLVDLPEAVVKVRAIIFKFIEYIRTSIHYENKVGYNEIYIL